MPISVSSMSIHQVSTVDREPGATLHELQVRFAAELAVGPWVKFSPLLGDRVLQDAGDLALVDLGIKDAKRAQFRATLRTNLELLD